MREEHAKNVERRKAEAEASRREQMAQEEASAANIVEDMGSSGAEAEAEAEAEGGGSVLEDEGEGEDVAEAEGDEVEAEEFD